MSAPDQIRFARTNEKLEDARRLALRMAVLAQVHVSLTQYENAASQFVRAQQAYDVEHRLAEMITHRQESDAQSILDRVSAETSAITADLRRYQLFAQAQSDRCGAVGSRHREPGRVGRGDRKAAGGEGVTPSCE